MTQAEEHRTGWGKPWERFVILLAAILVVTSIGMAWSIGRHQQGINGVSRYDNSWMMSQGALEISAAVAAAQDLRDQTNADAAAKLQLRLDILAVRLDLLSRGELSAQVESKPEWRAKRQALADALAASNDLLRQAPSVENARRIQEILRPIEVAFYQMANLFYVAGLQQLDNDISSLSDMHWRFSLVLGLVVACMIGLVLILRLRNRMVEQANMRASKAVAETRLQNARFNAALNNMSQALCMVDGTGKLIVCNERFAAMFELPLDLTVPGILIQRVFDEAAPHDYEHCLVASLIAENLRCAREQCAGNFNREDAQGRAIAVTQQPIEDGGWVATYEDITDRKRSEARIAFLAHHDSLTGLPNRLMLTQALEGALERGTPFAVLFVDLDGFKSVNDALGHMTGDVLLQAIAKRMEAGVPETALAARLGGDEFAIMLPGAGQHEAEDLSRKVIVALADPFVVGARTVVVGASIGIALAAGEQLSVGQLLRRADVALYSAKAAGRGRHVVWRPDITVPEG